MKYMMMIAAGLALAVTLPAWAAPEGNGCANGLCSATGLPAQVLNDAARSDKPAQRSEVREELKPLTPPRDAWNRYLHPRDDRENFDCILSFGVGGELSKDGFLGTRVLGQTQTWRAPDSSKPGDRL